MSINIRRVRSFCALAEHGGFRAAADAIGISQPTLSAHIAELEAELEVPLVSRTTRRVRLTRFGERFLVRARRALNELDSAVREVKDEASIERGRIVLACTPTLAAHAIPPAIAHFLHRYPGIAVEVVDDVSGVVEQRVADGSADFAVAPRPQRLGELAYQPFAKESFLAVLPPGIPFRKTISVHELSDERLISLMPGTSVYQTVERAFRSVGLTFAPAFAIQHLATAIGFARAGLGIAILPESAVSRTLDRSLRKARVVRPEIRRDFGLLHRRGEPLPRHVADLINEMRRTLSKKS